MYELTPAQRALQCIKTEATQRFVCDVGPVVVFHLYGGTLYLCALYCKPGTPDYLVEHAVFAAEVHGHVSGEMHIFNLCEYYKCGLKMPRRLSMTVVNVRFTDCVIVLINLTDDILCDVPPHKTLLHSTSPAGSTDISHCRCYSSTMECFDPPLAHESLTTPQLVMESTYVYSFCFRSSTLYPHGKAYYFPLTSIFHQILTEY